MSSGLLQVKCSYIDGMHHASMTMMAFTRLGLARARYTRGRAAPSQPSTAARVLAAYFHDSHSFGVEKRGLLKLSPYSSWVSYHISLSVSRLLDSVPELRRIPLRMTLFQ